LAQFGSAFSNPGLFAVPAPPDRKLHVVWSQDDLHRRTPVERVWSRRWRSLALGALGAAVVAIAAILTAFVLVDRGLRPLRRPVDAQAIARARAIAQRTSTTLSDVSIIGHDDAILRGWSFSADAPARGTVIALHGIGDSRGSQLGLAELLIAHGYRVLLPDARAHGSSGGDLVTGGILERSDLAMWTDWSRQQHPDECVFAIGASLGAATVLRTLGSSAYCAAIVEAPFLSLQSMALFSAGQSIPVPLPLRRWIVGPFVRAGLSLVAANHGVRLAGPDSLDAVRRSRVPLLVIVDGADDAVPKRDATRVFEANPNHVTVWTVPGAGHTQGWSAAPQEFPNRVLAFLARHQ
jgi:pimeloyl-ACP methyl ester carboxylesterase